MASDAPRFVLDTNVLVSAALFPQHAPGRALTLARSIGRILTTQSLIEEVRDVFARSKFDRYLSRELREEFLVAFVTEVELVQVIERVNVCRDPKDNQVLEAAISAVTACIVSGDDDLLSLQAFRDIPILTPADFVARYGASPLS